MKTIVTYVYLKPDAGRDWDAVMRKRLAAAKQRPAWVGGQLLRPADNEDEASDCWHVENPQGLGGVAP
jgi:hypothetical protein